MDSRQSSRSGARTCAATAGAHEQAERNRRSIAMVAAQRQAAMRAVRSSGGRLLNNVLKGKLLESDLLQQQAMNNTKEQFANSPDLTSEIMGAIMDALAAHGSMSKQALGSDRVRSGLKDVLLGPAGLYEALRDRGR